MGTWVISASSWAKGRQLSVDQRGSGDGPGRDTVDRPRTATTGLLAFGREPQDLDAPGWHSTAWSALSRNPFLTTTRPSARTHAPARAAAAAASTVVPAEAIISIGEQVEVNPNLCQGGGICATVCPTGAMEYAYPARATPPSACLMLRTYLDAGGSDPLVLFVAEWRWALLPLPHPKPVADRGRGTGQRRSRTVARCTGLGCALCAAGRRWLGTGQGTRGS